MRSSAGATKPEMADLSVSPALACPIAARRQTAVLLVQSKYCSGSAWTPARTSARCCRSRGALVPSPSPDDPAPVSANLWYTLSYVPYGRATARRMLRSLMAGEE